MIKIDLPAVKKAFNLYVQKFSNTSKRIVRRIAYDTGDMEFAITAGKTSEVAGALIAEVFVDSSKLYQKRKFIAKGTSSVRYTKKGNRAATKKAGSTRLYPIYVHEGVRAQTVTYTRKRIVKTSKTGKVYKGYKNAKQMSRISTTVTMKVPARKARPFFTMTENYLKNDPIFTSISIIKTEPNK